MNKNITEILDFLGEVESKLHIENYFLREAKDMLKRMEEK